MNKQKYTVYVKTDDAGRIIGINSDAFLSDLTGWTNIDKGRGDKFLHAQGNYLAMPLFDYQGVPNYKLDAGHKIVARSKEEMDTDRAQIVIPEDINTRVEKLWAIMSKIAKMMGVNIDD